MTEPAYWRTPPTNLHPLLRVLRHRRDLQIGLVQAAYLLGGLALGLALPWVQAGPSLPGTAIAPLLFGVAGGLISFVALVFSLLFLVVQYGNTSVSPAAHALPGRPDRVALVRLLRRGVVYATVAGISLGSGERDVSILVPVVAIVGVLAAMVLSRNLQLNALQTLQFPTTMEEIRRSGEEIIRELYEGRPITDRAPRTEWPPVVSDLRWTGLTAMLRQIDLPALYREAIRLDAVVEIDTIGGQRGPAGSRLRQDPRDR